MSSVSNSSLSISCIGSCIVCCGVGFEDEKKLNLLDVTLAGDLVGVLLLLPVESKLWGLGLFGSFAASRSGDASIGDTLDGDKASGSVTGIPNDMGALEPENQELSPPLCFPSIRTTPLQSPVSVGMNSSSSSRCVFSFLGLMRSGLVETSLDFVRNGKSAVSDRWWERVCRRAGTSSSWTNVTRRGEGHELRVAGSGSARLSPSLWPGEKVLPLSDDSES